VENITEYDKKDDDKKDDDKFSNMNIKQLKMLLKEKNINGRSNFTKKQDMINALKLEEKIPLKSRCK
jgi:hypothetical protein